MARLHDLLANPFGPYIDQEVLSESCKSTPTNVLVLKDVMLEWGGRATGLTECEPNQPEYVKSRELLPIRFRGVLEIKTLSWLTPLAQKYIEKALRERDMESRISGGSFRSSSITLESIYSGMRSSMTGLTIKLCIQGERNMPFGYLTTTLVPNGLMLTSKNKSRAYEVMSMAMSTYTASRTYLARFRLLKVLKTLVDMDKKATRQDLSVEAASVHDRTPRWFADLYCKHMAPTTARSSRRIVYTSSDSDMESDTEGRLRENVTHIIRHISRAEVYSLFAAHAEWILHDQRATRRPIINIGAWDAWVLEVKRARRDAKLNGVQWGVWDEHHKFERTVDIGSDADEDYAPPSPLPPPRPRKRKTWPAQREQSPPVRQRPPRRAPASRNTASTSRSTTLADDEPMVDDTRLRTYDSDFSPASTSSYHPSSSSTDSRPPTPINPEIMRLIHPQFFHEPPLPTGSMIWRCPERNCGYKIDLLNITEENTKCKKLSAADIKRMRAGGWYLRDPWIVRCFHLMVGEHIEDHWDQAGFRCCLKGKRWIFEWKRPQDHAPWPPERVKPRRPPVAQPVKDEEL